jgi:microcystin-dependent protein
MSLIDIGTLPDDKTGDQLRHACMKINDVIQMTVLSRNVTEAPTNPSRGDIYLTATAGLTGDLVGHENQVFSWHDTFWQFYTVKTGWKITVANEDTEIRWNGSAWVETDLTSAVGAAQAAMDKASEWAEKNEDVEVEAGKFSAKHYAQKAAGATSGVVRKVNEKNPNSQGVVALNASDVGAISKIVSATDIVIGRAAGGAGNYEEIPCTAAGRGLLAALDVEAQKEILGITQGAPVGSTMEWHTETPPDGYLEHDGSSLSRTTYAALFAVIGTRFGFVDSSTFNLPDDRGEFKRGWDHGRGVDSGRALNSHQDEEVGSHVHDLGRATLGGGGTSRNIISLSGTLFSGYVAANSGAENRARNNAVMYCIKY